MTPRLPDGFTDRKVVCLQRERGVWCQLPIKPHFTICSCVSAAAACRVRNWDVRLDIDCIGGRLAPKRRARNQYFLCICRLNPNPAPPVGGIDISRETLPVFLTA